MKVNNMDSNKKKLLWLAIVVLVIVGILVLVWSLIKGQPANTPDGDLTTDNQPVFETDSLPYEQPAEIQLEQNTDFTVSNLAKAFTDRYGSWSTDNQGQNLAELFSISSARMRNYLENIELNYTSDYLGVTTKTLSANLINLDEQNGEAIVEVQAQRIETRLDEQGNVKNNNFYQKAIVELIQSGENWLVDGIFWQ